MKNNNYIRCLTVYPRNCTSYDCGFWYAYVKWWCVQQNFSFFRKSDFSGFQSSLINAKRKFWGVPHLPHMSQLSQLELSRTELPKCTPNNLMENCDNTILPCFIDSFLYNPANKAWLFEKFIFELEASYSFKITCILVRQVISLKKIGGVISKIYCLILWSPICTPLILVSASMKMAGTSVTVTYNLSHSNI